MDRLFDRIYGCLAASNIGSAMGAATEGWEAQAIVDTYGVVEEFLPYAHYGNYDKPGSGRKRPPGTTEDGIERQRLLCTAIIEKGGRINAEDLAAIWRRDINPDNFCVQMEPCDEPLYRYLMAGIPPTEVGRYSNFLGIVSYARSCHPIGLINPGDPKQAAQDVFETGRLYQPPYGYGLDWAAAVAAAIAEAMKPDATIDTVLRAGIGVLPEGDLNQHPKAEVMRALDIAQKCTDPMDMRWEFNKIYNGRGMTYALSMAHEIVSKGFAVFAAVEGDPREAIKVAVNFGRDTDCLAAVASGIAGAFRGMSTIPKEWVDTVDEATAKNPYTVSQRSLMETAVGMHQAAVKQLGKYRGLAETFGVSSR